MFFSFWELLGVPKGVIFGTFSGKNRVSGEKEGLSFLHTFLGLGPPEGL